VNLPAGESSSADFPLNGSRGPGTPCFWAWAQQFQPSAPGNPPEPPPFLYATCWRDPRNLAPWPWPSALRSASRCSFSSRDARRLTPGATPCCCASRPTHGKPRSPPWCFACLGRGRGSMASGCDVTLCHEQFPALPIAAPSAMAEIGPWRHHLSCMATPPAGAFWCPNIFRRTGRAAGVSGWCVSTSNSARTTPRSAASTTGRGPCHRQGPSSAIRANPSRSTIAGQGPFPAWRGSPAAGLQLLRSRKFAEASLTARRARPASISGARPMFAFRFCNANVASQDGLTAPFVYAARPAATGDDPVSRSLVHKAEKHQKRRCCCNQRFSMPSPAPSPREASCSCRAIVRRCDRADGGAQRSLRASIGPRETDHGPVRTTNSVAGGQRAAAARAPAQGQPVYRVLYSAQRPACWTPARLGRFAEATIIRRHQRCVRPRSKHPFRSDFPTVDAGRRSSPPIRTGHQLRRSRPVPWLLRWPGPAG